MTWLQLARNLACFNPASTTQHMSTCQEIKDRDFLPVLGVLGVPLFITTIITENPFKT